MEAPKKTSFFHKGGANKQQLKEQLEILRTVNESMEQRLQEKQIRLLDQQGRDRTYQKSLQDQLKQMDELKLDNSNLKKENGIVQAEIQTLSSSLAEARVKNDVLEIDVKSSNQQLRDLEENARSARAEADRLTSLNNDLREVVLTKEDTVLMMNKEKESLQERQRYLEEMLLWLNKQPRKPTADFCDGNAAPIGASDEVERNYELSEIEECRRKIEVLTAENDFLRQMYTGLQEEEAALRNNWPKTLRSLLIAKVVQTAYPPTTVNDTRSSVQLDKAMGPTELLNQLHNIFQPNTTLENLYQRIRLKECMLCSKAKFAGDFQGSPLDWLYEFPAQGSIFFPCCCKDICRQCFLDHLSDSIRNCWWYELDSLRWLSCPKAGCGCSLSIRCEADLQICLERNQDPQAEELSKIYGKTLVLRQALEVREPKPSTQALQLAADLHKHLIKSNRMYSFFDPKFDSSEVDENGCLPDFDPGTIMFATVDRISERIPIFIKFFHRQSSPKTCIICAKPKYDIEYGNVEAWRLLCKEYSGPWMWDILAYPTSEIQYCNHSFDVCRYCTAEHISSMLDSEGYAACDRLCCPQCSRHFSYEEVIRLASTKTVEQYEKFLLMKTLSNEPHFRWCLNPDGCPSGQLYATPPRCFNQKITCEECKFEMCFDDQIPWHTGLSCQEWKNQRDHGDPNIAATQEYMQHNAKPCPGCTRVISKDGGCFHMTCTWCGYQYCWVCLVDYQQVYDHGQQGHKESCYFRNNAINPMYMRGSTLEEAIERREMA